MHKQYCDIHTLSRYLGMSSRRIQELVKRGIIPRRERGKYELIQCIHSYIEHLHELLYGFSGCFWTRGNTTLRRNRPEVSNYVYHQKETRKQLSFFKTDLNKDSSK